MVELNSESNKSHKFKRTTIQISRIPEKSKTEFVELANKEFSSDFGMTVKWLLDFRSGLLSSPNEQLSARIDILADEINTLKGRMDKLVEKKDEKILVTASGKKLRIGGTK